MRNLARFLVLLVVGLLTVGPFVAPPVLSASAVTVTAPQPAHSPAGAVLQFLAYGVGALGAIRIKDTGSLAKKFVTRAVAASGDYKDGVSVAGGDWETRTKASEDTYNAGVQQGIADKRFGKGVADAGQAKYVTRATTLGAQRFGPGVAASEGEWAKGTQPYLDALKSMDLPARRPKGDPANQQIANAVASRLAAIKRGR